MPPEHKSGSQSPRSSFESQSIKRKPLPVQGPSHLGNAVVDQLEVQPPESQQLGLAPTKVYEAYNPDSHISLPPAPPPHTDRSHITSGDHAPVQFTPVARKPVPVAAANQSAPHPLQPSNGEEQNPPLPPRSYLTSRSPSPNSRLAPHHISNRPSTPNKKAKKALCAIFAHFDPARPDSGATMECGTSCVFSTGRSRKPGLRWSCCTTIALDQRSP